MCEQGIMLEPSRRIDTPLLSGVCQTLEVHIAHDSRTHTFGIFALCGPPISLHSFVVGTSLSL